MSSEGPWAVIGMDTHALRFVAWVDSAHQTKEEAEELADTLNMSAAGCPQYRHIAVPVEKRRGCGES